MSQFTAARFCFLDQKSKELLSYSDVFGVASSFEYLNRALIELGEFSTLLDSEASADHHFCKWGQGASSSSSNSSADAAADDDGLSQMGP